MTPDTMTQDQRSLLLYLETCAVDHGGLATWVSWRGWSESRPAER